MYRPTKEKCRNVETYVINTRSVLKGYVINTYSGGEDCYVINRGLLCIGKAGSFYRYFTYFAIFIYK